VLALHLRPGAREWYLAWLDEHRPDLRPIYDVLYARGAYVADWYASMLHRRVAPLLERHGLARSGFRRPDAEGDYPAGSLPVTATPTEPRTSVPVDEPALF
jgi:hypothetical protein